MTQRLHPHVRCSACGSTGQVVLDGEDEILFEACPVCGEECYRQSVRIYQDALAQFRLRPAGDRFDVIVQGVILGTIWQDSTGWHGRAWLTSDGRADVVASAEGGATRVGTDREAARAVVRTARAWLVIG